MKHSKFFQQICILGLGLLVFSACSKDDDSSSDTDYTLTAYVNQPSEDGTEYSQGKTWQSGDQVTAIPTNYTRKTSTLTYNSSKQAFEGPQYSMYSGMKMALVYPATEITFGHSDTIKADLSVANQDGLEANLKDIRIGKSDSCSISSSGYTATAQVKNIKTMVAKATFHFTHDGEPIQDMWKIQVYAEQGKIYQTREFNLRSMEWSSAESNTLEVVNSNGLDGSMVVAMLPTDEVTFGITIQTKDGMRYFGKASESVTIEQGGVYEFSYDLDAYDQKAKIGDYMYTDGTFDANLDYSKTPVGIVFALTDTYDGDINPNLTESYHGRLVSLKDLTTQTFRWAYSASQEFDIPLLTTYEYATSGDSIAFLPYLKNGNSTTYFADSCHINLSIDLKTGAMKDWPKEGALSSFDGKENTAVCDSTKTKFASAYYCANLNRAGISNKSWYLPALGEMALLYELQKQGLITAITKPDYIDLEDYGYWSSDEAMWDRAWVINVMSGMVFRNYKLSYYKVRPCMHF